MGTSVSDRPDSADVPLREVRLWRPELVTERRADGTVYVSQKAPLGAYPDKLTRRLEHWAKAAPERTFLAERAAGGDWRRVSFGDTLRRIRRIGRTILAHDLSHERPIVILSENDIEHALLGLAAQYVGVPYAPISPAYSLLSGDHGKLKGIVRLLTPGMVFAADGARFEGAIRAAFPDDVLVVVGRNPIAGRRCLLFSDLLADEPSAAVDAAHDAVGRETIGKFLFTSGSTGSPKAVIQSQGMMCANQEMVADCYAFMRDEPPVVVDWAPWNHTASGNKVFNMVLYNGGTYHIDAGRPSPAGIAETVRNLREISPTWYFNVPKGYEELVRALEADGDLRKSFFANLRMLMYAGAGMAQHTWDALNRLSAATIGARVLLASGLGSTETGPFALMCTEEQPTSGNIGIPARGCTLKLVPAGGKLEARLKGPHITPGYWRNPELTAAAFDEEGFYRLGDALRFADPEAAERGFFFDGRLAENFKLATGTWVAVGALRAALVNHFGGLARDAVITGEDRDELGALIVPDLPSCRALAPDAKKAGDAEILADPRVRARFASLLASFAAAATGSSTRVGRLILLEEPPALDRGEITDKGSINQRAVLHHRADLVAAIYDDASPLVIRPA